MDAFFLTGAFLAGTGFAAVFAAAVFFLADTLPLDTTRGGAADEDPATMCVPSRLRLAESSWAAAAAAADRASGFAVAVGSIPATERGRTGGFAAGFAVVAMAAQPTRGEGDSGWGRQIGGGGCAREGRMGCFPFAPTPPRDADQPA